MVHSCAAINCTARWKKGVNLKFHRIPLKDSDLRKAWLHAIRRVNFDPKYGFICEKHFLESDYYINVHGNKVLKSGSIPLVFDFPKHLKKVVKERRTLERKGIVAVEPLSEIANTKVGDTSAQAPVLTEVDNGVDVSLLYENIPEPTTSFVKQSHRALRKRRAAAYFGDFKEADMNDKEKRKRFWQIAHDTVFRYRKLNKYYQCKRFCKRRQQKRLQKIDKNGPNVNA